MTPSAGDDQKMDVEPQQGAGKWVPESNSAAYLDTSYILILSHVMNYGRLLYLGDEQDTLFDAIDLAVTRVTAFHPSRSDGTWDTLRGITQRSGPFGLFDDTDEDAPEKVIAFITRLTDMAAKTPDVAAPVARATFLLRLAAELTYKWGNQTAARREPDPESGGESQDQPIAWSEGFTQLLDGFCESEYSCVRDPAMTVITEWDSQDGQAAVVSRDDHPWGYESALDFTATVDRGGWAPSRMRGRGSGIW